MPFKSPADARTAVLKRWQRYREREASSIHKPKIDLVNVDLNDFSYEAQDKLLGSIQEVLRNGNITAQERQTLKLLLHSIEIRKSIFYDKGHVKEMEDKRRELLEQIEQLKKENAT